MPSHTIILIKQTNTIQLGHLYEHLFCTAIEQFFHQQGLYAYVDYSLVGRTYYGGVIYVSCTLYGEKAKEQAASLATIDIDLSEESIHRHLSQIVAERHQPFGWHGLTEVTDALNKLHAQPWQNIREVDFLDVQSKRLRTGPVYIADGEEWKPKKVSVSIIFSPEDNVANRLILPLFVQFTNYLFANLQHSIAYEFGFFSLEDTFSFSSKFTVASNIFASTRGQIIELEAIMETTTKTIQELISPPLIERFLDTIRRFSYKDRYSDAPDIGATYEKTLLIVGEDGWDRLASEDFIKNIIQHTTVSVRCGNKKISSPIL